MQGPKRKLFLSYGRHDAAEMASRLRPALGERGFDVWQDTESLRAGADWQAAIERALEESAAVVALLSPHAVRHGYGAGGVDDSVCLDELAAARWKARIPIVPAMVVRCETPFVIARLHCADLTDVPDAVFGAAVDSLVQAIEAALRGDSPPRSEISALRARDDMPYLASKREGFEGRAWLFDSIHRWLDDTADEKALLITGDPGIGKTSILAELVHREDPRLMGYYCCRADSPSSLAPAEFLRSLAAVLVARLPAYAAGLQDPEVIHLLTDPVAASDPARAFDSAILAPLHAIQKPPEKAQYIFIDGLDEAFVRDRPGPTIVQVLAPRLESFPAWLRVLLTTRRDVEVLRQLSGVRASQIDAHGHDNQLDLRAYFARRLDQAALAARLADARVTAATALEGLLKLADGNFLVAREALRGIERDQFELARLDQLPPGIDGIYTRFFERMFPDRAAYRAGPRRILQAVAVAREPLSRDLLGLATGLDKDTLRDNLATLSSYLRDEDGTLVAWHKSLGDWLSTRDSEFGISPVDAHGSMADACLAAMAEESALSAYALRHGVVHLWRAGRQAAAGNRLADLGYIERKVGAGLTFDLADEYAMVLPDLQRHPQASRLRLIARQIAGAAHFLSRHPDELFALLWNLVNGGAGATLPITPREPGMGDVTLITELDDRRAHRAPESTWLRRLTPSHDGVGPNDAQLRVPSPGIRCFAVSPDGRSIAGGSGNLNTGQDCVARVWEIASGREILNLPDLGGPVESIAFDARGARLALCTRGSRRRSIAVYFTASGARQWCVDGLDAPNAVAFSPGGDRLACASGRQVLVFDAESGTLLTRLVGHEGQVWCLAWSPDGRLLASGGQDRTARIWDLAVSAEVMALAGHEKAISSVAIARDGKTVVTGSYAYSKRVDRTVRLWDLATGQEQVTLDGVGEVVFGVACSPDDRFVAAGVVGKVRVFDRASGREHANIQVNSDRHLQVAYLADGRLASGGGDDTSMRIWDPSTRQLPAVPGHAYPVGDMALTDGGSTLLSVAWDGVLFWDMATGILRQSVAAEEGEFPGLLAVSPSGTFATLGQRGFVRCGQSSRPRCELELPKDDYFRFAAFSADGRTLVARGHSSVTLWDVSAGRIVASLNAGWAALSADGGQLLVLDKVVSVVDLATRKVTAHAAIAHPAHAYTAHPHRSWIVLLHDGPESRASMTLVDWSTGRTLWSVVHGSRPRRAIFSADGATVVTETHVRDEGLYRWDALTGRLQERRAGITDLSAYADEGAGAGFRLVSREFELQAEACRDGNLLASLPGGANRLLRSSDGRTWATLARGSRAPSFVALEGARVGHPNFVASGAALR